MSAPVATRTAERRVALIPENPARFLLSGVFPALIALVLGYAVARSGVAPIHGVSIPLFLVLCLAAGAISILLFGPSYLMCGVFLLVVLTGHESLSFVTWDFMGVEWHPREIFLGLLLGHAALQTLRLRVAAVDSPVHPLMMCYGLFFLLATVVGVYYLGALSPLLGEIRFALFVLAYVAFVACMPDPRAVWTQVRLAGWVLALIAMAAILFFLYAMCITGPVSFLNEWGAFIRRDIRGWLVQTARPNGHFFFESAFIVCAACLFAPGLSKKQRALLAAANLIFLGGIVITGMRTAYISTVLGMGAWGLLALPLNLRLLTGALGVTALLLLLVAASLYITSADLPVANEIEVSLRARMVESEGAWTEFTQHPLLGGGLGASFEGLGLVAKRANVSFAQTEYVTLHNYWMYFLFKGGLCGFILAAVGLLGLVGYGIHCIGRQDDALDRALVQGMTAALIGQCIASLTMARLYYPAGQVFVAFAAVLFYVFGSAPRRNPSPASENEPPG